MITDANGNRTSYEHDLLDRVVAEVFADGTRNTYEYDAVGNLVSKTDPRRFTTTYAYDDADQLVRVTLPDGVEVRLAYDPNGNLTERVDGTGTYRFEYDAMNRPVRITQNDKTFTLSYDADGRQVSVVHPDGRTATMAYDETGQRTSVATPDLGVTQFSYDDDGRRTGVAYPNGTTALSQYDLGSRLVRLVHRSASGAAVTPDFRMTHDAAGNPLTQSDGATPLWTYGYDTLDRLVSARNEITGETTTWSYDPLGNRLAETTGGVTTPSTYNALNQLVRMGDTTVLWDGSGNLMQQTSPGAASRYRFDSRDRLVWVQMPDTREIHYGYDQQGRLVSRTDDTGTTTFEWNGWDIAREISPTGRITRYFYNGSEMVAFQRDEMHYRLHSDGLGSVRAVTDHAGNVVARFDYEPWGGVIAGFDNVPGGWPYRFVGSLGVRWEAETELHYMRQRWYASALKRFATLDPLIDYSSAINRNNEKLRAISTHGYNYGEPNPVLFVDPYGLFSIQNFPTHAPTRILENPVRDLLYSLARLKSCVQFFENLAKCPKPKSDKSNLKSLIDNLVIEFNPSEVAVAAEGGKAYAATYAGSPVTYVDLTILTMTEKQITKILIHELLHQAGYRHGVDADKQVFEQVWKACGLSYVPLP